MKGSNSRMSYIIEKSPKIIGPRSKFIAKSQSVVLCSCTFLYGFTKIIEIPHQTLWLMGWRKPQVSLNNIQGKACQKCIKIEDQELNCFFWDLRNIKNAAQGELVSFSLDGTQQGTSSCQWFTQHTKVIEQWTVWDATTLISVYADNTGELLQSAQHDSGEKGSSETYNHSFRIL